MELFLEAESFKEKGGWVVDQQSMEIIGSAYIMAHGMGVPVEDAKTDFTLSEAGEYNVWVLTRDWTASWNVKEPAGRFTLKVDGAELPEILGTKSESWDWQKAGSIRLKAGSHQMALHDLTGFNGRCDAVYLTTDTAAPCGDTESIAKLRQRLGWKEVKENPTEYDLVVIGGGIAGICTALSATKQGVKALLINDRPVLGGCNSSEIRVCLGGQIKVEPYPNIGDVVRMVGPVMGAPSIYEPEFFEDSRKKNAFRAFGGEYILNESVTDIEAEGKKITAVICTNVLTGEKQRIKARLFCDCSGDGIVARKIGAEMMYGYDSRSTFGEDLAPIDGSNTVMGHSIRWCSEDKGCEVPFPDIDWGLEFDEESFLNCTCGDWEQETGFTRNMAYEAEYIRDYGLRAIYSNWSYQKNRSPQKDKFKNLSIKWVSSLGGKREGYRVVGDYILTQADLENKTQFNDPTAAVTWGIDLHFPEPINAEKYGEAFRSFAFHKGIPKICPVPYRCLYAKDADNLFIGGRIVSCSHIAFSAIRVMRTLGMLGEVVGIASGICKKHGCNPRQVYTSHLEELKELLKKGVYIPDAFECPEIGDIEKYHFKDIGWWVLNTGEHSQSTFSDENKAVEKFKKCIGALGLKHSHPLPDKWK